MYIWFCKVWVCVYVGFLICVCVCVGVFVLFVMSGCLYGRLL